MPFTPWAPVTAGGVILLSTYAAGDGVTDASAGVQAWLSAVAAGSGLGAAGYAPPGTYLISTTPALTGATGIKLRGAGRSTVFRAAAASQPNLLSFTSCTKVEISDIAFDGNRTNVNQIGTQYLTLAGIWLRNCDDVTIDTCRIDNCYSSGIMANGGSTNLMIRGCRLTNSGDNQIYIRAQNTTPFTPCSNVTVLNCVASGGSFSGIQFLGSTYITATGNVCYSNGPTSAQGDGIGSEGSSYVTITGNVCYANGIQGIQSRFTSEVGTNQQSSHIVIADNVVYNHTSANGDAGGIGVNDTDDIAITGNLCYSNNWGLNVNGGFGLGVSHLQAAGNTFRGNVSNGIRCSPGSGTDYVFTDNYVTDNAGDNLITTAPVTVQGGTYSRATGTHEGIHLQTGANGSLIDGASIVSNTDNGVLIDSPVTGVSILNCYFNGSGTDQLRALQEQAGAGPTVLSNCRILNQKNQPFVFNNAASLYIADTRAKAVNFKPANPASTVSLTAVMMGLGSTCTFTPVNSGTVTVTVTGYGNVATATAGISCGGRYGTGTAPVNGAAASGTQFGSAGDAGVRPSGTGSGGGSAYCFTDVLALTPGTTYWFDLAMFTSNAADAASIVNVSVTIGELL